MIRLLRGLLVVLAALCALAPSAFAQTSNIPFTDGSGDNMGANTCGSYKCPQNTQSFQSIGLSNISGPGASFTLSTATTAYTAGLLICSNATAATCNTAISAVWWVLPTGTIKLSGGSIRINDSTATAWATNTQIQIDLWSQAPTMTNGDRLAWAVTSGTANWLASLLCTTAMGEQGDGVTFNCTVVGGPKDLNLGSANAKVYGTYLAYSGSGVTGASASLTATLTGTF